MNTPTYASHRVDAIHRRYRRRTARSAALAISAAAIALWLLIAAGGAAAAGASPWPFLIAAAPFGEVAFKILWRR